MNYAIRPTWQAPDFVHEYTETHQDGCRAGLSSLRQNFNVGIDAVTEKHGTPPSNANKSMRSHYTPRQEYNEKFDDAGSNSDIDGIDWRPGFKHQFPWIGFAGLMVIFVATATAVAILVSSHKQRVKDWPFTR
jgi:hypothetical protein